MLTERPDIVHRDVEERYLTMDEIVGINYPVGSILEVGWGRAMGCKSYCRVLAVYTWHIVCEFFRESIYDTSYIASINKKDIALHEFAVKEV